MKVNKDKFNECIDYLRKINKSCLSELDVSEFGITNDCKKEWRFVGLNNVDFIKYYME